ncbi:MAG TPA: antibiotic biosynthesis monooxygenase family protein [Pseudonocardiaceae bacterium]|jgi:quinol monooxygenase YgiN
MIIIAGSLYLDAAARDRYLAATFDVARQARLAPGCFDFVQSADPIDPERINIYERWESDEDLHRFRAGPGDELDLPDLRSADVHKYRISAVELP